MQGAEAHRIEIQSPRGSITYIDSIDHFENGFLRLMRMSRAQFEQWLELSESVEHAELLDRLQGGFTLLSRGESRIVPVDGSWVRGPMGLEGAVLYPSIAESASHGIACEESRSVGWLVRSERDRGFCWESDPPMYEKEYFEGDPMEAGGYGEYLEQAGWRMEKAFRQLAQIRTSTGLGSGHVLDVGSGYGYFRRALGEHGFVHEGLEVSNHARLMATRLFGFDTHDLTLEQMALSVPERYDLLTMWDVLEHVPDPFVFLSQANYCLRDGGFLAIKTPNLVCPEAELFGPNYHSFKREHLVYLTAASLNSLAHAAGFLEVRVVTSSHLLRGFVGAKVIRHWEATLVGSDIDAVYRKVRPPRVSPLPIPPGQPLL